MINFTKLRKALKAMDVMLDEQQRAANGQFGSGSGTSKGGQSKVAQVYAKNKAAGLTQPSQKEREAKGNAEREKAKKQTTLTPEQTKKAQAEHHANVKASRIEREGSSTKTGKEVSRTAARLATAKENNSGNKRDMEVYRAAEKAHEAAKETHKATTQALSAARKYNTLASAKSAAGEQKYPVPILHGEGGKFLVPSSVKEASHLINAGYEKA